MDLTLTDELMLLALDDEKGNFVAESLAFTYALSGSIIMELSHRDKIDLRGKDVIIKGSGRTGDALLDSQLELIRQSKKVRKIDYWIDKIGGKESDIIENSIAKLVKSGILRKEEKKYLWVFTSKKYPTSNPKVENLLRGRLLDVIEKNAEPSLNEIMLISLVDACSLNVEVFGKEKAKKYKKRIKSVIEESGGNAAINEAVKEIHDAVMACLVIMMTTVVITSS
ncbi:GOLPH3/VPS74 family protein [Carboxylicivirga sp. N1Y90]|uniref:GOLPH3/VPS74 family protein n=1 Tax=Carboxylicivirga fragile TaxID=3417571 RepID=UPI003D33D3F1|nr:GPP34 family phosphoprotein [Marinilabiliaceae bacterium N1Y90]